MTVDLYLGDCLEILSTLADNSVDAVITDPPYGLNYRNNGWDSDIPEWLDKARLASNLVAFTTAPTTQWDYPRPDWVCCWNRHAAASRSSNGGFNHWSPILFYGDRKIPVDVYETMFGKTVNENMGIDHPSPKPLELYIWLIDNLTYPGDTILDPFMGSGTTGVACVQTGRNFIGIEIEPKYFEIAEARIAEAQLQMRMPI